MRKGEFMFEIVKTLHEVFRVESTWAFVLVISMTFGTIGGFFAWIIDRSYKNSVKEQAEQHDILKSLMRPNKVTEVKAVPTNAAPAKEQPQVALTAQQAAQIVQTIVSRYVKKHKSPPSVNWVNQRLLQQGQTFRVMLKPRPNYQRPEINLTDVHMDGLIGPGIDNSTDWQFNIQDSSIKSAGDGIVNTNENARFNIQRTKIDAANAGIKNTGSQDKPKPKPLSQQ